MYILKNEVEKLLNHVPKIDFLDVGSRGGIVGWFKIIESKLNIVGSHEAEESKALSNTVSNNIDFFLTEEPSQSSLFEPNEKLKIYENQKKRLKFEKKKINTDHIDNLYFQKNLDIIKVDTQGSEYEILEGGLKTISNSNPLLFLETWSFEYYKNIKLFDEIILLLRKINYEIYALERAASHRVDISDTFNANLGLERCTGFNLFMAPKLEIIKKLELEKRVKISFIFFTLDLLSHAYYIIDDINDNIFRLEMEKIIHNRVKYSKVYDFKKYLNYIKLRFGINKNFYKLT